jgi:hypothetical protein
MREGLDRIPTFFEYFQKGGHGWPSKGLAKILDQKPADGAEGFSESLMKDTENGVTVDLACSHGTLILAWREFRSSPQMRGSLGQQTTDDRVDDEQIPSDEAGEQEVKVSPDAPRSM